MGTHEDCTNLSDGDLGQSWLPTAVFYSRMTSHESTALCGRSFEACLGCRREECCSYISHSSAQLCLQPRPRIDCRLTSGLWMWCKQRRYANMGRCLI